MDETEEAIQECQEIIYDYSMVMKDADYLRLCNALQFVYHEIQDMRRTIRGHFPMRAPRSSHREMTSGECMMFLLNVIKGIIWLYTLFILVLMIYLVLSNKPDSDTHSQRYLKTMDVSYNKDQGCNHSTTCV